MIGRVGSSGDSSFLCLLAIYAVHVLLFHVWAVVPFADGPGAATESNVSRADRLKLEAGPGNTTRLLVEVAPEPRPLLEYSPTPSDDPYLAADNHQVFVRSSSACLWESSFTNLLNNYSKISVDFSLLSHYFHRIKSIFTTSTWSSSTWGIISGCAIFLLTYTERENAQ